MQKFETYFGLKLGNQLFGAAEEVSKVLQTKDLSVQEAVSSVNVIKQFYKRLRRNEEFDRLFDSTVAHSKNLRISEPQMPRYRKAPRRLDEGSQPYRYSTAKKYLRCQYFEACDLLVNDIESRFEEKEFMEPVLAIEALLIKSANGKDFSQEFKVVKSSCFQSDFCFDKLERHLGVLVDVIHQALPQVKKITAIRTICEAMNKGPYEVMLEEVHKLLRLYFTIPITSSTSERAFSTLRRVLTYLRSTMTQERLNNCMLLHVHKDLTDSLNLQDIAVSFITAKNERLRYFGTF